MTYLKSVIRLVLLATLVTSILLPTAWADVLVPEESRIDYCFQIANLNKYSNYLLIAHIQSQNGNIPTYNRIIKQGKCIDLNRYREFSNIYAIKKSQVKPQEIIADKEGEALKNFNAKKKQLISSQNPIHSPRTFPDKYKLKQITDVLEIVSINSKSLNLKYKEAIYTSKQGTSQKKTYQRQDERPLPSGNYQLNFLNLIIPGLLLTSMILIYQKLQLFKKHN